MSQAAAATPTGRSLPTITSAPAAANMPVYEKMALAARDAFLEVCDEKTWMRELSFAMQIIGGNNLLQNVAKTPAGAQSIKNAIINVAMTGTTLNPVMQKAYLVPRSIRGIMMCCLDFSYRGLAGIAMDSGTVRHIAPRLVYNFDTFKYTETDGEQHIVFEKNLLPPEDFTSGPAKFWDYLVCGYVVATLHDGTKIVTEPLPKWKLKKAMDTSKTSSTTTPWHTHPDEQCLKTLVKHAYKLLPQTPIMSKAVSVLNEHEGVETEAERRNSVANAFMGEDIDDASFTSVPTQAAPEATAGSRQASTGEPTVVPVITPQQCEEIIRRIEEIGVNEQQFLAFLEVKHIADIPQSSYGTALAALENKRRQNEQNLAKKQQQAEGPLQQEGDQSDLFTAPAADTAAPATTNEILAALAAKNISAQIDDEGTIHVKISFNDGANKEFVKGLGFRWDAQNKTWYWKQA